MLLDCIQSKNTVMTTEKKAKLIAGTVTGLLILALAGSVYFYNAGQNYKSDAAKSQTARDSILTLKQQLDQEIAGMRIELTSAKGRNDELDRRLAESTAELNKRQAEIDRLVAENASLTSLRRQLKDLKAERESLNEKIQQLTTENQDLTVENQRLRNNVNSLESEKLALQNKLSAADFATNRAGNFRVDMMRNSGKVTSKARKTRDMLISFDMPANNSPQTAGKSNVYVVLIGPDGKPVTNKSTKSVTLNSGNVISPIRTHSVDMAQNPQTIEIKISLDEKIKEKGIYTVRVFSLDGMLGSSQIKMN